MRRLCVARSVDEAIGVLEAPPIAGMQLESDAIERGVVFMFTGQGSQYPGMARILYAREPIFRDAIDACARHLEPGLNLQELLAADLAPEILERTDHAQPALFALAWALTQLWQSRGVEAEALIGHSLGEYVAACVGGVMSLEDALATVMVRGRLMQACPPGAMLAVHAPLDQVRDLIRDEVTLAAINGPEAIVLSGPTDAIDETAAHLDSAGVACRRLATSHAFHSPLMESMLEAFREHLAGIRLQPPQIDIVSNVTGTWLSDDDATDPEYWIRQLRQTVRFAEGVDTLAELDPVFLEIGAGDVLGSLVKAQLGPEAPVVPSLPGVRQAAHAERWMTQAFGRLWLNGGKVDWRHVAADEGPDPRTVSLPPYPFQRRRFATGAPPALSAGADRPSAPASGKDPDMDHWFHVPAWERVAAVRETGSSDTCWLVFGAPEEAAALASDFEASVVRLHAADRFARREDGGYDLDPRTAGDYRRLFAALAEDGIEASQWVQLPGASMRYGPDALVALAQAMIGADAPTPGLLSVITRAGQSVTGTEHLDPDSAALAGLAQVLMQEVPDLCARTIDIDNGTACPSPSLHQELGKDFHYAARLVALRGRYRWQRAFRSLPLKREAGSALRDQGVYAIVGDLSAGLGMHYARSLRSEYDARLILVAPPELPPVNEWDHWLDEHDSMHPIGQFIGRARALGREGEDWLLSRIDLGDRAALGEALLRGTMRFGPIDGVFHADVMGDAAAALLADLDPRERERLMYNKVAGSRALGSALGEHAPAFVLLQSSMSSIVGGAGFAAYAAANHYLDALPAKHGAGTRYVSINWDACALDDSPENSPLELLAAALSPQEVWEATCRILAQPDLEQVVVTPRPLAERIQRAFDPEARQNAVAQAAVDRPRLQASYVAPRTPTEQSVADAMGELLGLEKVGADDDFFALGGNSLLAIQAVTRLRKEFDVELPMRALLQETPTVAGIAAVIEHHQAGLSSDHLATVEELLGEIEGLPQDDSAQQG